MPETPNTPNTPSDGRGFLFGKNAAAVDAQMYHIAWFIHGRWDGALFLIAQFPQVRQWASTFQSLRKSMVVSKWYTDTCVWLLLRRLRLIRCQARQEMSVFSIRMRVTALVMGIEGVAEWYTL